ncbi:hypothetical protein ABIE58_002898 [Roseovarius sp. MBR-78]|jgi:hypothetical protein
MAMGVKRPFSAVSDLFRCPPKPCLKIRFDFPDIVKPACDFTYISGPKNFRLTPGGCCHIREMP